MLVLPQETGARHGRGLAQSARRLHDSLHFRGELTVCSAHELPHRTSVSTFTLLAPNDRNAQLPVLHLMSWSRLLVFASAAGFGLESFTFASAADFGIDCWFWSWLLGLASAAGFGIRLLTM